MIFEFDSLTEEEKKIIQKSNKVKKDWVRIGVDFAKS